MPNYHLGTNKNRKIDFTILPGFENYEYNKISGIVNFTTRFFDEKHLKNVLLKYKLITEDEYKEKLVIFYKNNKQIKRLQYGLAFNEDIKFFDIEYIKHYLTSKMNDAAFLNKLCNHYRSSYIQGTNIDFIRNYIYQITKRPEEVVEKELIDDVIFYLNNFVDKEIYNKNKELQPRRLRDLAMFLAYDNKIKENKEKKQEETINPFITEETSIVEADLQKIKVKTRNKKKNNNIPNQLSFEDIGWL